MSNHQTDAQPLSQRVCVPWLASPTSSRSVKSRSKASSPAYPPPSPSDTPGVINLRGAILPILELHHQMEAVETKTS